MLMDAEGNGTATSAEVVSSMLDTEDTSTGLHRQDAELRSSSRLVENICSEITDDTKNSQLIALVQCLVDRLQSRGVESLIVMNGVDGDLHIHGSANGVSYLNQHAEFTSGFEKFINGISGLTGTKAGEPDCQTCDCPDNMCNETTDNHHEPGVAISDNHTPTCDDLDSRTRSPQSKSGKPDHTLTQQKIIHSQCGNIKLEKQHSRYTRCKNDKHLPSHGTVNSFTINKISHKRTVNAQEHVVSLSNKVNINNLEKTDIPKKVNIFVTKQDLDGTAEQKQIVKPHNGNKVIANEEKPIELTECRDAYGNVDASPPTTVKYEQEIQCVECVYCHQMFKDREKYQIHVSTNECSKVGEQSGNDANSKTDTKSVYKSLVKKVHILDLQGEKIVCDKCGMLFENTAKHDHHIASGDCELNSLNDVTNGTDGDHKCEACHQVFPKPALLKIHDSVCGKAQPDGVDCTPVDMKSQLDLIYEVYTKCSSSVKCFICKRYHHSLAELVRHVVKQHDFTYTCHVCKEQLNTRAAVRLHVESHVKHELNTDGGLSKPEEQTTINNKQFNKCGDCGLIFKDMCTFRRHTQKHVSEKFPCNKCRRKFISKDVLEIHLKSHNNNFTCSMEGCSKSFGKETMYLRHLETHKVKKCLCNICGKVFPSSGKLKTHAKYHTTERNFECETCGCKFKTKDVWTKHVRIHKSTKHYYCEICGQGFNQSGAMQRHMGMHQNIKAYTCEECGVAYRHQISLRGHRLRTGHDGDKVNFKVVDCPVCGKQFVGGTRKSMKRHMLIHTGEKPFKCDICARSFNDKSNLKHHVMIHEDNRPFGCQLCQKRFTHNRSLRKHMESHDSGESPSKKGDSDRPGETVREIIQHGNRKPLRLVLGLDQSQAALGAAEPRVDMYLMPDGSHMTVPEGFPMADLPRPGEMVNTMIGQSQSDIRVSPVEELYNNKKDDLEPLYEYKNLPDIVETPLGFTLAPARCYITSSMPLPSLRPLEPMEDSIDQSEVPGWAGNVLGAGLGGAGVIPASGAEVARAIQYASLPHEYLTATPIMMSQSQSEIEPENT